MSRQKRINTASEILVQYSSFLKISNFTVFKGVNEQKQRENRLFQKRICGTKIIESLQINICSLKLMGKTEQKRKLINWNTYSKEILCHYNKAQRASLVDCMRRT